MGCHVAGRIIESAVPLGGLALFDKRLLLRPSNRYRKGNALNYISFQVVGGHAFSREIRFKPDLAAQRTWTGVHRVQPIALFRMIGPAMQNLPGHELVFNRFYSNSLISINLFYE